ncbi:MAG: M55 family metallopeptidase [Acidobacteria bacterium]|nr:M55 family metallopeptidase [Acidobacteriota bacterium]
MLRILVPFLALSAILVGAQGPRIFIVTDMEGVGGVHNWDEQVLVGQRRFDESRRLLTGEVNAAVEGAMAAGASEVVIWDGHGGSRSLSIEDIRPPAQLVQGQRTPADFYLGGKRYDGLMFVGQHAKAGTKNGLMAHSQSLGVKDITINGKSVGEMGQAAAIAGYFKTPVLLLTGDQAACDEMLELQPKAETVAVKQFIGRGSALSLPHSEAKDRIRAAARRAVTRIREFKPWIIEGPVEMKFEYLPGKDGKVPPDRVYRGQTVLECFEQWLGGKG